MAAHDGPGGRRPDGPAELPDLQLNRDLWDHVNAAFTDADADRAWQATDISWGLFSVPERDVRALGDVAGRDVVELGCGTAYFSARLARAGARPVGVDLSPAQLDTARRCQQLYGPEFPLIEASAEDVPLPDQSFDLVVSEYGASVWCDPERWVAEAARLLRPGGRLVFLTNSVLVTLCVPEQEGTATEQLLRAQPATRRVQWPGGGIEYHPGHGDWVRILRRNGFAIDALHELYSAGDTEAPEYYGIVTSDWARRWPAEDLWVATLQT